MEFFTSPDDLRGWIKSKNSSDEAVSALLDISKPSEEKTQQAISDTCKQIFENQGEEDKGNASAILFGVLANSIAAIKTAEGDKNMKIQKVAQDSPSMSRQRNGWVRGMRNKWNRVVDGFNEGTPWRIDRDKFYNFTHYYIDDLKFDEDPSRVYSGEAIWRMYVMDKFTTEHLNKEGKWVGGYINDRFYVFPTAGTPSNPDAPRDGGNQMSLAPGERTRLPRPHQYSTERRLEEARKGDVTDNTVNIKANDMKTVKIASSLNVEERKDDKIYNIFRDVLDMEDSGIEFKTILEATSKHYNTTILRVAQIYKAAQKLKAKHEGMIFSYASETLGSSLQSADTWTVLQDVNAVDMSGKTVVIPANSTITKFVESLVGDSSGNTELKVKYGNDVIKIQNWEKVPVEPVGNIQEAATDLGLNEESAPAQPKAAVASEMDSNATDFAVNEVPKQ